jgi:hypothetical protein
VLAFCRIKPSTEQFFAAAAGQLKFAINRASFTARTLANRYRTRISLSNRNADDGLLLVDPDKTKAAPIFLLSGSLEPLAGNRGGRRDSIRRA